MTTKSLNEMTMTELVQADIANSNHMEIAGGKRADASYVPLLRRRREIRAEIDRRKAAEIRDLCNLDDDTETFPGMPKPAKPGEPRIPIPATRMPR